MFEIIQGDSEPTRKLSTYAIMNELTKFGLFIKHHIPTSTMGTPEQYFLTSENHFSLTFAKLDGESTE